MLLWPCLSSGYGSTGRWWDSRQVRGRGAPFLCAMLCRIPWCAHTM